MLNNDKQSVSANGKTELFLMLEELCLHTP